MRQQVAHPYRDKNSSFVHSRIDADIKEQATSILDTIGLNISDAIRLFVTQIVLRKGLPFAVSIPNAETIEAMEAVEKDEGLEVVTLDQLHTEFQHERKKLALQKKKRKK